MGSRLVFAASVLGVIVVAVAVGIALDAPTPVMAIAAAFAGVALYRAHRNARRSGGANARRPDLAAYPVRLSAQRVAPGKALQVTFSRKTRAVYAEGLLCAAARAAPLLPQPGQGRGEGVAGTGRRRLAGAHAGRDHRPRAEPPGPGPVRRGPDPRPGRRPARVLRPGRVDLSGGVGQLRARGRRPDRFGRSARRRGARRSRRPADTAAGTAPPRLAARSYHQPASPDAAPSGPQMIPPSDTPVTGPFGVPAVSVTNVFAFRSYTYGVSMHAPSYEREQSTSAPAAMPFRLRVYAMAGARPGVFGNVAIVCRSQLSAKLVSPGQTWESAGVADEDPVARDVVHRPRRSSCRASPGPARSSGCRLRSRWS